jgi:hypothetical protein
MPDLLTRLLDPEARRRGLAEARLLTEWSQVVGAELAAKCQPIRLGRDGILQLHVSGPAALELQHGELQVLERINGFFGYPAVRRLALRQAPARRRMLPPKPAAPPPLSEAEEAAIRTTVAPVEDEGLRAALAGLGSAVRRAGRS